MKLKYLIVLLVFVYSTKSVSQTQNNDVLFTVDSEAISTSEFIRVYNKNLDLVKDESQKDIDEYLKLFINYKLKLREARALGLDKKKSYIKELSNYKKQLAKNFLTDTKVTDELVKEAYERVSYDVQAKHVLVRLTADATPQDTLVAYNKILRLRDRVIGEGYEKVQKEVHNGNTIFAEDLGYFTGFKMVYDFENVAYSTSPGEVSMPFRTQFGYHIVKVYNKRKSRGEITVAHIMVAEKVNDTLNTSEKRIHEIYTKLQQGEKFNDLARQFSEDKSSASKDGELASFTGGQLTSIKFENESFSIKNIGDITEPFKTKFGWHIVKLINKKPVQSFDEMRVDLETKVKKDARSKLISNSRVAKLKKKYNIQDNTEAISYFTSILNNDFFKRKWMLPENFQSDNNLFTIGELEYNYKSFGNYLINAQRRNSGIRPLRKVVSEHFNTFLNNALLQYQEQNLENENEEFAQIVGEYRDGLLLFDLMESEIWNSSKTDTLEIKEFYEKNKEKYFFEERIDADVASSAKKSTIKKVMKSILKTGMTPDQIKEELNTNDEVNVIFTSGIMDSKHQALPKGFVFKQGVSNIFNHNNNFVLVHVKEILPKKLKTFDESKGNVISDYQEFKENSWLNNLKTKFQVEINHDVLNRVKNQINN